MQCVSSFQLRLAIPPQARLRVEQPAILSGIGTYHSRQPFTKERDAYVIPLKRSTTWIDLVDDH